MCLGIPGQIVEIIDAEKKLGIERFFGRTEIMIQSKDRWWGKFVKLKK